MGSAAKSWTLFLSFMLWIQLVTTGLCFSQNHPIPNPEAHPLNLGFWDLLQYWPIPDLYASRISYPLLCIYLIIFYPNPNSPLSADYSEIPSLAGSVIWNPLFQSNRSSSLPNRSLCSSLPQVLADHDQSAMQKEWGSCTQFLLFSNA